MRVGDWVFILVFYTVGEWVSGSRVTENARPEDIRFYGCRGFNGATHCLPGGGESVKTEDYYELPRGNLWLLAGWGRGWEAEAGLKQQGVAKGRGGEAGDRRDSRPLTPLVI